MLGPTWPSESDGRRGAEGKNARVLSVLPTRGRADGVPPRHPPLTNGITGRPDPKPPLPALKFAPRSLTLAVRPDTTYERSPTPHSWAPGPPIPSVRRPGALRGRPVRRPRPGPGAEAVRPGRGGGDPADRRPQGGEPGLAPRRAGRPEDRGGPRRRPRQDAGRPERGRPDVCALARRRRLRHLAVVGGRAPVRARAVHDRGHRTAHRVGLRDRAACGVEPDPVPAQRPGPRRGRARLDRPRAHPHRRRGGPHVFRRRRGHAHIPRAGSGVPGPPVGARGPDLRAERLVRHVHRRDHRRDARASGAEPGEHGRRDGPESRGPVPGDGLGLHSGRRDVLPPPLRLGAHHGVSREFEQRCGPVRRGVGRDRVRVAPAPLRRRRQRLVPGRDAPRARGWPDRARPGEGGRRGGPRPAHQHQRAVPGGLPLRDVVAPAGAAGQTHHARRRHSDLVRPARVVGGHSLPRLVAPGHVDPGAERRPDSRPRRRALRRDPRHRHGPKRGARPRRPDRPRALRRAGRDVRVLGRDRDAGRGPAQRGARRCPRRPRPARDQGSSVEGVGDGRARDGRVRAAQTCRGLPPQKRPLVGRRPPRPGHRGGPDRGPRDRRQPGRERLRVQRGLPAGVGAWR